MKPIPQSLKGKDLFNYLVKNEDLIIHAKKSAMKMADEAFCAPLFVNEKGEMVDKSEAEVAQSDPSKIKVALAINTTNYFDSHGDVHIPGLWKKSLFDNKSKGFYLLKKHRTDFEDVIAEEMKGAAKQMSWAEMGYSYPGITEVLLFSGTIDKDRNPYMFDQYRKKYVKQHSVGMRYVKIVTCINDDDYPVQKENWDKYIEMVANRKEAEEEGYFWAVLEAQIVEGSAVLFGSNDATPTLQVTDIEDKSTLNEPLYSTQEEPEKETFSTWLTETKLIQI